MLVARVDEHIVGHLQLVETATADRSEIKNMAVVPSQRGRGIGRALVDAAVETASEEGRATLCVATAAADIGNLRFYQRVGFRLSSVEVGGLARPLTGRAQIPRRTPRRGLRHRPPGAPESAPENHVRPLSPDETEKDGSA